MEESMRRTRTNIQIQFVTRRQQINPVCGNRRSVLSRAIRIGCTAKDIRTGHSRWGRQQSPGAGT